MRRWRPTVENLTASRARFAMAYSEAGVGKTLNALLTLPEPIAVIYCEKKKITDALQTIYKQYGKLVKMDEYKPETQDQLEESVVGWIRQAKEGKFPYKSALFDSPSYWMNTKLRRDAEKETASAKIFEIKRPLIDKVRVDKGVYGGLPSRMRDLFEYFADLSNEADIPVLLTAHLTSSPKWDVSLAAVPYFIGNEVSKTLPYIPHLVGLMEHRPGGGYPPIVTFKDPTRNILVKWTGVPCEINGKIIMGCDWSRILEKSCVGGVKSEDSQNT
jgi:hypothetical protein